MSDYSDESLDQIDHQRSVTEAALLCVQAVMEDLPSAEQLDSWVGNAAAIYAIRVAAISGLLAGVETFLLDARDSLDTASRMCSV